MAPWHWILSQPLLLIFQLHCPKLISVCSKFVQDSLRSLKYLPLKRKSIRCVWMKQFNNKIYFLKKFKMIHDKITCMNKIFEMRFNFWSFYESFWLTKIVRFQILSKSMKFEIFFEDAHSNLRFCSRLFLAQHSHLRVIKVFTVDTDISCFSLILAEVFSVIIFLYDVNQSYFLPISVKIFFRWCLLGLFSHWHQSWKNFANVDQGFFGSLSSRFFQLMLINDFFCRRWLDFFYWHRSWITFE